MPLENAVPRIDDRNYDSLIAEVRTRIARYTPEWTPVWTDVNDNDPGVTLAQVFAWLAEMLAYREEHQIQTTWPAGEHILVCVSPSPASARIVRAARRMAERGRNLPLRARGESGQRRSTAPAC